MDKSKFIKIYNDLINNKITTESIILVIEEYCKINKKDEGMISTLINSLLLNPPVLYHYFTISLEGLFKHFEIIIIKDLKTNNIIKII